MILGAWTFKNPEILKNNRFALYSVKLRAEYKVWMFIKRSHYWGPFLSEQLSSCFQTVGSFTTFVLWRLSAMFSSLNKNGALHVLQAEPFTAFTAPFSYFLNISAAFSSFQIRSANFSFFKKCFQVSDHFCYFTTTLTTFFLFIFFRYFPVKF